MAAPRGSVRAAARSIVFREVVAGFVESLAELVAPPHDRWTKWQSGQAGGVALLSGALSNPFFDRHAMRAIGAATGAFGPDFRPPPAPIPSRYDGRRNERGLTIGSPISKVCTAR